MEDKSLANKAVNIKGKQYVLVQDRVLYFLEHYETAEIRTELLSNPSDARVVVKATVMFKDKDGLLTRVFTGHSQAVVGEGMVNKTAALENAETSAVGRALAFMGIGVIESIASADEIHKATSKKEDINDIVPGKPATPKSVTVQKQKEEIKAMLDEGADAPLKTKADYENECMFRTGMKLEEAHYADILAKLKE